MQLKRMKGVGVWLFFLKAVQKFMVFVHLNMHSHNVCA